MEIIFEKDFNKLPTQIQNSINNYNIFYSQRYRKHLHKSSTEVAFLYNCNFIILVQITKKYIFKFAHFPAENIPLSDTNSNYSDTEFLDGCIDYLKNVEKIQWITVTPASSFFKAYPKESLRIPFGNHVIDLSLTEDELFSAFHSKHRNSVNKAKKSEVVIKCGRTELLHEYCHLDKDTWERSGKSGQTYSYYESILNNLNENAIIFIAYKDDIPQGGAIFYYNKEMSYYMFAASKNRPESGSMNLLHWEAIKYMKLKGVKQYSFVGCRINEDEDSKYHDIQRFKKRFGGQLVEGYLFKSVLNRNYYNLFNFLIKFKNKSYDPFDVIDQEIHKWYELQINN